MSQPTWIAPVSVSDASTDPSPGAHTSLAAALMAIRTALPWAMLVGLFASLLWMRVTQPGDLHDDDQSKTMAYTVDMVRNHLFAMPRDMYRQPATKPPMYNWLTLPFIYAFQSFDAWVFKLPSILAAMATCALIIIASRSILAGTPNRPLQLPQPVPRGIILRTLPTGLGIVATAIFLGNQPVYKMMYLCRPDMLLTAFLTGAWVFGTMALVRTEGSTKLLAALFWICVAGASLTKGPPALAALIYVLIAAPFFAGGVSTLRRLHWWMAVPLLLLPLAAWIALGYYQSGKTFFQVLFVQEMFSRVAGGGPEGTDAKPWWQMAVWFFQRFGPWSLLAMVVVISLPREKWTQNVLSPIIVWIVLVLIFFSIPGGKRADYLLPIYPPAAIAAAFLLVVVGSWLGVTPIRAMIVVTLAASYTITHLDRSRVITSDPTEKFAKQIAPMIKKEAIVMTNVAGYQPLLPLLGRFDGTPPVKLEGALRDLWLRQLAQAKWVVMPVSSRWKNAHAVSGDVPGGRTNRGAAAANPIRLALYRVGEEGGPTKEDLKNMYRRRGVGVSSSTQFPAELDANDAAPAPTTTATTNRTAKSPRRPTTIPR